MKTYPHWVFDDSPIDDPFGYGERAVQAIGAFKHPMSQSPKRRFELAPWQERIVRQIYGPRLPNGNRIVRKVVLLVPRGNRKTAFCAALALLHTIGPERNIGGLVQFAASDRGTARVAFEEARNIIQTDRRLKPYVGITDSRNYLGHLGDRTRMEAISSDAGLQHGRTPSFVLVDELHAWPKRDLFDVMETSLTKTPNTLMLIATTAGRGHTNHAWETIQYARKVASGEVEDPSFLPILFEADPDEDWTDEELWHRVNPGMPYGFPDLDGMRIAAREASTNPGKRDAFRQLHLNMWLEHSTSPFVDMEVYDKGAGPVDPEAMGDAPCFIGVDLSSNKDLTAVVMCWRDEDDRYVVKPHFFVPEDNIELRASRDGVPYPRWRDEGLIEATPGPAVDYKRVEEFIREQTKRYRVEEIAFDPYGASAMMQRLDDDGLPVLAFPQGWRTMSPAISELERAILSGKFVHGGHPVLRWNFNNIAVEYDKAENRSFHKKKSKDRIDGAVASAMAVARAAAYTEISGSILSYI
ncbi:terminase large subunit [Acuticoccus sediminis]|nr:terminase TerL endonuclease subunit [Acuticoccus sediminis]